MTVEPRAFGFVARLHAGGLMRFFSIAFLGVWLCGWLAGELGALGILGYLIWLKVGSQAIPSGMNLISNDVGALIVGSFLLLWLTVWSFAGRSALWEFFRLLRGVDVIDASAETLLVVEHAGPFHRTKKIECAQLLGFFRKASRMAKGPLMAETRTGSVQMGSLGSPEDVDALEQLLSATYARVVAEPLAHVQLPEAWEEIQLPEGGSALVAKRSSRRRKGAAMIVVCTLILLLSSLLASHGYSLAACLVAGLCLLLCWGTLRLLFGRFEWRWDASGLHLDWRMGERRKTVFSGTSLELEYHRDSDGDSSYVLAVFQGEAPDQPLAGARRPHREIERSATDPRLARRLGEWLERRSGIPLIDRSTPEYLAKVREHELQQLESSGKLGAFVASLVKRVGPDGRPRT